MAGCYAGELPQRRDAAVHCLPGIWRLPRDYAHALRAQHPGRLDPSGHPGLVSLAVDWIRKIAGLHEHGQQGYTCLPDGAAQFFQIGAIPTRKVRVGDFERQ